MTVKLMFFIDGSWLYSNRKNLRGETAQEEFVIDYGKLPSVLGEEVLLQTNLAPEHADIVRSYLFGSYPENYAPNPTDDAAVRRQQNFFDTLKREFHYEVETFPRDFQGRALRRAERDPTDAWEPAEKCVDIALATSLLYYAAVPHAYDIAVAVIGDRDFLPVLQHVRRLGKRVAIASIRGSCAREFSDPRDEARVKDFDIIWINDLLERLELSRSLQVRMCQDPNHAGEDRSFETTYQPRRGEPMYCDACRERHRMRRAGESFEGSAPWPHPPVGTIDPSITVGTVLTGTIKTIHPHDFYEYYGFISAEDGNDYYFNPNDLDPTLRTDEVAFGLRVEFEVKRRRTHDKQGAAHHIRQLEDRARADQSSPQP